ncbi:putative uridine kinase [Lipomyces kononenkoae]
MESVYSYLTYRAKTIRDQLCQDDPTPTRVLIAVAGPPGSGKSTIAKEVVTRLNAKPSKPVAVNVPMDGFHLTQATLNTFPNREEAFARRGAPWTFDADGVVNLVTSLYKTSKDRSIVHKAPGFDHITKDPVKDAITITSDIEYIILEGNWLLLDEAPWSTMSNMVHDTWFVDVQPELALKRVAYRHIKSGIESNWNDAVLRAQSNDLPNGTLVRTKLVKPGIVVQSVEESVEESEPMTF